MEDACLPEFCVAAIAAWDQVREHESRLQLAALTQSSRWRPHTCPGFALTQAPPSPSPSPLPLPRSQLPPDLQQRLQLNIQGMMSQQLQPDSKSPKSFSARLAITLQDPESTRTNGGSSRRSMTSPANPELRSGACTPQTVKKADFIISRTKPQSRKPIALSSDSIPSSQRMNRIPQQRRICVQHGPQAIRQPAPFIHGDSADATVLEAAPALFQSGSFNYHWLLGETHAVLKKQLKAEKKELMLVAGAIAGLASALSLCKEEEGQDVEQLAFSLLNQSIQQVNELKRYHGLRASLHLLQTQAWRFVTQIMADAQALIDRLGCMTTHQNKLLRDAAEMALESVLAQVAKEMDAHPQDHQLLHSKLMGSVTQQLISPTSSKPEKNLAMRTAGALAKATYAIHGTKGIRAMMDCLPRLDIGQEEMEDKIAFNEHTLKPDEAADPQAGQDENVDLEPVWTKFMPLWLALLMPEASSPLVGKKETIQLLYDALVRAVLDIIPVLDLSRSNELAHEDLDDTTQATDAIASAKKAASLSSLQAFLRVAHFSSQLLTSCPGHLFLPWSTTFTGACIDWSRSFPLLSGFYRLLTAALRCLDSAHRSGISPYLSPVTLQYLEQPAVPGDELAESDEDNTEGSAKQSARDLEKNAAAAVSREADALKEGLNVLQPRFQRWLGQLGGRNPVSCVEQVSNRAENSPDRSCRVAACEFIHATVLWMLGANAYRVSAALQEDDAKPTRFHKIMRCLYPVVLRLAASAEPIAQQLFHPLIMSLIHWFTRSRREAAETVALLDAVMEGLANATSAGVRDLCASAVREFLHWSFKHNLNNAVSKETKGADNHRANFNVISLLQRLFERLAQPEPYMRLGSAKAMQKCVSVFRQQTKELGRSFLLEAVRHCIKSLQQAAHDDSQLGAIAASREAIRGLTGVLSNGQEGDALFEYLMKPAADKSSLSEMGSFIAWAWSQSASPNRYVREACMWLLEHLCKYWQPDTNMDQGQAAIAAWLAADPAGNKEAVASAKRALTIPDPFPPPAEAAARQAWMQALDAAVHWMAWVVQQRAIPADDVMPDSMAEEEHAAVRILNLLGGISAANMPGPQQVEMTGLEDVLKRVTYHCLQWLRQVIEMPVLESATEALASFVLTILFQPSLLSMGQADEGTLNRMLALAQELIQAAKDKRPALLHCMRRQVEPLLVQMLQGSSNGEGQDDGQSPVLSADLMRGLQTLQQLHLPAALSLIPQQALSKLPEKMLAWTSTMHAGTAAHQRAAASKGLQLAIQLGLPPQAMLRVLLDPVAELVNDTFPASSHDLQKHSTQDRDYRRLLLQIMSGGVRAAEDTRDVSPLLEAMLPVLRELGEKEGHRYGDSLKTRLALIAAAPWKGVVLPAPEPHQTSRPSTTQSMMNLDPAPEAADKDITQKGYDLACEQASAMFAYAWSYAMEAKGQPIALRQAMMEFLLLPCLQYAPPSFASSTLPDRVKELLDIVNSKLSEWPPLRDDFQASLVAKAGAYKLLRIMYLTLPPAEIKDHILKAFGGNGVVMRRAAADIKGLVNEGSEALSNQTRQAAYACSCALVMASQQKEHFFKSLLDKPETWSQVMNVNRKLDFDEQQQTIDSPAFQRRSSIAAASQALAGPSQNATSVQATSIQQATQDSLSMPFAGQETDEMSNAALHDMLPTNEDVLDAEPAMLAVVQLVERAAELFEGGGGNEMPTWMQGLHTILGNAETPHYLRLFLIKVIIHVDRRHADRAASQATDEGPQPSAPSTFGIYQRSQMTKEVDLASSSISQAVPLHESLAGEKIPVFTWRQVASAHSSSPQVVRSNYDYIRVLASKWRSFAPIPVAAILTHLGTAVPQGTDRSSFREAVNRRALGMKLLCAGLLDKEQVTPMLADPDMQSTTRQLLHSLSIKGGQKFAEQTGEAIGVLLSRLARQSSGAADGGVVQQVWQEARRSLISIHNSGDDDRFMFALDRLSARHKPALSDLRLQVASSLARCSSLLKAVALKVMTRAAPNDPDTLWSEVMPQLPALLGCPPASVQNSALQLCKQLMQTANLTAQQVSQHILEPGIPAFQDATSPDCQLSFFELLSEAWQLHAQLQPQLRGPLLALLASPSPDLRRRALRFWHSVLPASLPGRLVSLISLATELAPTWRAKIENHWAQSSALLLMELAQAHQDSSKSIYDRPLAECNFVEYPVDTLQMGTHLSAPMFSPQWTASQSTHSLGASSSQSSQASPLTQMAPGMVVATQTYLRTSQSFSLTPLGSNTLALSGGPSGPRSPSKPSEQATLYRRPNSRPSAGFSGMLGRIRRRQELRAAQNKARSGKVTLARQYRTGELPDIQSITIQSFLAPLGIIIARDKLIAGQAFTTLAARAMADPSCTSEKGCHQKDLQAALAASLAEHPEDPQLVDCLLGVAMAGNGVPVPVQDAASAAKRAGCLHTGVLQVEESLLLDHRKNVQQKSARSRGKTPAADHPAVPAVSKDVAAWAELAGLYAELGLDHFAQAAYSGHITRCSGTKQALQAASGRCLNNAFTLYESLMRAAAGEAMELDGTKQEASMDQQLLSGQEPSAQEEDMWFRERNRCMEMLGEWDDLLTVIDEEINGDPSRLLADGADRQYLRTYMRASLFSPAARGRNQALADLCLASPEKAKLVQLLAPVESTAQTVLLQQWDRCQSVLRAGMAVFTDSWTGLSPLSVSHRLQALSILQPLTEIQEALAVLGISATAFEPCTIDGDALALLIVSWQARWPSTLHASPLATLTVIGVRDLLLGTLLPLAQRQGALQKSQALVRPGQSPWQVATGMRNGLLLGGAKNLGAQGFLDTAQDLITRHLASAEATDLEAPALQLSLRVQQAKATTNIQSWLYERLAQETSSLIQLTAQQAGSEGRHVRHRQLQALQGSAEVELALAAGHITTAQPGAQEQHLTAAVQHLLEAGHAAFSSGEAAAAGAATLQLAKLCHTLLQASDGDASRDNSLSVEATSVASAMLESQGGLAAVLVKSVLNALHHGTHDGQEAQLLVPVVMDTMHNSEGARRAWEGMWQNVPLHLLLPWAAQMLSLMDQREGASYVSALQAMAEKHKQAMFFPFRLSWEHWSQQGRTNAQHLEPLMQSEVMQQWATALSDIIFPLQRWQGWMQQLSALLREQRQGEAVQVYVDQVFPDMIGRHRGGSSNADGKTSQAVTDTVNGKVALIFKKPFDNAFGVGGTKLKKMQPLDFQKAAKPIVEKLSPQDPGKHELSTLSPWFDQFGMTAGDREAEALLMPWMPSAQAVAHGPPEMVEIVGFAKCAEVFSSKQRPMKLTVYGSDFRSYDWIAKGGEDVRIDQRIQQLFGIMNGQLQQHTGASACSLKVPTYDVVPISPMLGMVAFVPSTQPLQSLLERSTPTGLLEELFGQHTKSVYKLAKKQEPKNGKPGWPELYDALFKQAHQQDAEKAFFDLQSNLRWDVLRDSILRLAGAAAEFLLMRSTYMASLASVSICGYIAGSGDRHLGNLLLDVRTGALVPIDFGYSFGTAVQALPVPELMPFRLTRQLVGPLFPHAASSLLKDPCALALAALRAGRQTLLGVMGVFMREPLLDWQRESSVLGLQQGSSDGQDTVHSLKVGHAAMKLMGRHPAEVMVGELKPKHSKKPSWKPLQSIVWGARAIEQPAGPNGTLSCEQQADCLLRQASDPFLLFCSFAGWKPWL
ncbi:hypothetical protein WJX84_001490 [Apatococcus fuscideae]|uniref:Non-specific serine/threonine protein kinase n=1 Tax=Apatococcus fuscideae TaxID=2026836 RepID=A0AAW1TDG3_9CHLO